MNKAKRDTVIHGIRQRIIRALATGALRAGDRLPSTREFAAELEADPRLIGDAYRQLEKEGLVALRQRSGVYVSGDAPSARLASDPPASLLTEVLTDAALRGHPGPRFAGALRDVVFGRTLRTVVISTTADQGFGLARELREDFGLETTSVLAERISGDAVPDALRRAQLIVTTKHHAPRVRALTAELNKPLIVVSLRHDVFESEWSLWRGQTVHVIVLDPRFRTMLVQYMRGAGAEAHEVQIHLATDSVSQIPPDAPTYVTQAARTHLGKTRIPGMLIPPTRLLDESTVREIWSVIVQLNQKRSRGTPETISE